MHKNTKLILFLFIFALISSVTSATNWRQLHEELLFLEKTPADFAGRQASFINYPLAELLDLYKPEELTFNFDDYLDERCPEFMQKMLSWCPAPKITLIAGFTDDAVSHLKSIGVERFGYIEEHDPVKIKTMKYLIVPNERSFDLYITNLYGHDWLKNYAYRLVGMAKKYDIPLENIKILYDRNYKNKSRQTLANSVSGITYRPDCQQWILIGYQGAFYYFLRDLLHFVAKKSVSDFVALNFERFLQWNNKAKKQAEGYLPQRTLMGDARCPYFKYSLDIGGELHEIYSFRNMFGDQSQMLIQILLKKGFRNFAIFGNAGGLSSRVKLAGLYAPVSSEFNGFYANGLNRAAEWFMPVRGVKVSSLFEEDWAWLKKHENQYDFVDVEQYDMFRAFADHEDARYYSAVLISDFPGALNKDITDKQENSADMILGKENFYFHVVRDLLKISLN